MFVFLGMVYIDCFGVFIVKGFFIEIVVVSYYVDKYINNVIKYILFRNVILIIYNIFKCLYIWCCI